MILKKIFILSVFIIVCSVFGCAQKDRIRNNTMTLSIEPKAAISINVGAAYSLTAIIKNAKYEDIDEPVVWSISNSSIGVFTSSNTKSTDFVGASAGTAVITLTCQGMQTSVNVTVSI